MQDESAPPGGCLRCQTWMPTANKLGLSRPLYFSYRTSVKLGLYKMAHFIEIINRKNLPDMNIEIRRELLGNHYLREISELEGIINQDLLAWKRV